MHPLIRLLRVIGGICTILALTKKIKYLPNFVNYLLLIIIVIFIFYNCYIGYYRIIYIYKTLKSDKLDIKNSPLDKLATIIGKTL
jgi:hypothetical protein